MNIIQYGTKLKDKFVVSLDVYKAFDRVKWPYLFPVLANLGLGANFLKWIKVLYVTSKATLITKGKQSPVFLLERGTAQGCPLSSLLFALVIEPLAEAIRTDLDIKGIHTRTKQHKISLYADDVLLYLCNPTRSINCVNELIEIFSTFTEYLINYSKSEAMSLSKQNHCVPTAASPFGWSPLGFTYLGIRITPSLPDLYKANFTPLI